MTNVEMIWASRTRFVTDSPESINSISTDGSSDASLVASPRARSVTRRQTKDRRRKEGRIEQINTV